MASTHFESNLRGFLLLLDDETLKVSLDEALRTAVKDILLLIFKQRFHDHHPNQSLTDVALHCPAMKSVFMANKSIKKLVIDNDETTFDITALYQFLRHLCGLPKKEELWNKSKDSLPGHICCLREVRNLVSHRTTATKESLIEQWTIIVKSSKETLTQSGNDDRIPEFMLKFQTLLGAGSVYDKLIMELQEIYSSKEKTTLKPFIWAGVALPYHKHVKKTYTPTSLSIYDSHMNVEEAAPSTYILSKCTTTALILEGESGTGKTALLRYFASCWKSSGSSENIPLLNSFDLLLFLDCDGIKVLSPNVNIIIQEILPKTSSAFGIQQILKEITKENLKVLFLIDAFDERLSYMADIFEDLQKIFRNAKFLISTRPHCSAKIKSLCTDSVSTAVIKGFDYQSARLFIKNILNVPEDEYQEFLSWISVHKDIKQIPQLLTWTLYLWKENKNKLINNRFTLYNDLTYYMIKKLCYINKQRIMATSLPDQGQLWLQVISELAYRCLLNNQLLLTDDNPDIENLICKATELKFRDPYEAISTLIQSQSSMTGDGEVLQFQFIHVSHVEYLVAYHVVQRLKTAPSTSNSLIKNLSSLSDGQVLNILQFVLSLSDSWWADDREGQLLKFVGEFIAKYFRKDNLYLVLALIDCSNNNERMAQIIGKKWKEKFESEPHGLMWIRKRDLVYKESLKIFMAHASPTRIWANIGQVDISLPSISKNKKENVNIFLEILRKAFDRKPLIHLTISHGIFDNQSTFNQNLSWLTLIDCEFQHKITVPKTLLKLTISSSTGLANISLPKQVESLAFHYLNESIPQIPTSVKHLQFKFCKEIPSLNHLNNLESLSLSHLVTDALLSLPDTLKKFKCSLANISIFESIQQVKLINTIKLKFLPSIFHLGDSEGDILIEALEIIRRLEHLKEFSIEMENASAEQILEFILDLASIDDTKHRKMKININVASHLNEFMSQIIEESLGQLKYISLSLKFANLHLYTC